MMHNLLQKIRKIYKSRLAKGGFFCYNKKAAKLPEKRMIEQEVRHER